MELKDINDYVVKSSIFVEVDGSLTTGGKKYWPHNAVDFIINHGLRKIRNTGNASGDSH